MLTQNDAPPVRRTNFTDVAEERIRTLILERVITPGEPLDIRELADAMQISRTPVITAIDRLVTDGIVERPGAGSGRFVVASSDPRRSRDAVNTIASLFGEGLGGTALWPEATGIVVELGKEPSAARTSELRHRLHALIDQFDNQVLAETARRSLDSLIHLAVHPHRRAQFDADAVA